MKIIKPLLDRLYNDLHLTMEEIGEKLGISRQGVLYYLQKFNISRQGERFSVLCDYCQTRFSITRKRWRLSERHFCSNTCKGAAKRSQAMTLERIKAKVLKNTLEKQGRKLKFGEIAVQEGSKILIFKSKRDFLEHKREKEVDNVLHDMRTEV